MTQNIKIFMKNFYINTLLTFVVLTFSSCLFAQERFDLVRVATPYKLVPKKFPILEDPSDREPDLLTELTVQGNMISFNRNSCTYEIEKVEKFYIGRALSELIDDAGGEKKFDSFLKLTMRTNIKNWTDIIFLKSSSTNIENNGCRLLQAGIIYRSKNEIIITDTNFFYRFLLSK